MCNAVLGRSDRSVDAKSASAPSSRAAQLLDEIVYCDEIHKHRRGESTPCSPIIATQDDAYPFQPPEPWSGLIESAPILFLSSNPSIDESRLEEYPEADWEIDRVRSFFNFRFNGNPGGFDYVQDGVRPLLKSGEYGRSVAFWGAVKRHADDLLGREAVPGVDYALSEVVHCKSRQEVGVKEAMCKCSSNYLDRLLQVSAASVVIVLGSRARKIFVMRYPDIFSVSPEFGTVMQVEVGLRRRLVAFMPHPNAHMKRRLSERVSAAQLDRLCAAASECVVFTPTGGFLGNPTPHLIDPFGGPEEEDPELYPDPSCDFPPFGDVRVRGDEEED
jgi:hypothetical protein